MSSHIFITFADADKATGKYVAKTLEDSGKRCWFAPRDIAPGASWPHAIIDAIASAELVVILVSAAGNESTELLDRLRAWIAGD